MTGESAVSDTLNTDTDAGPLGAQRWPAEIRLKQAEKALEIDWDDGTTVSYPAELLRVESPSAEVQGHGGEEKTIVPGRRHVGILEIEPVGNYAIRILFDDGHDTGLFTWAFLYDLGLNKEAVWSKYERALADTGLSRDPFPKVT